MNGYMGRRLGWRAEIAALRADLAALRASLDCPPAAEVEAELRKPSPLLFSPCDHLPLKPDHPVRKGWHVRMIVNGVTMRFRVAREPYEEDGETVVDLVSIVSGTLLEAVPVANLDIRRWAAESQSCGQRLNQPHKAAQR